LYAGIFNCKTGQEVIKLFEFNWKSVVFITTACVVISIVVTKIYLNIYELAEKYIQLGIEVG